QLPRARQAHEHHCARIGDRRTSARREPIRVAERPHQRVCVEQYSHRLRRLGAGGGSVPPTPSNASSSHAGDSSASSDIQILPLNAPSALEGATLTNGTSFATGVPLLAITISSPFATRASNFDKLVLAACTFSISSMRASSIDCGGG